MGSQLAGVEKEKAALQAQLDEVSFPFGRVFHVT